MPPQEMTELDKRIKALNGIKIWNKRNHNTPASARYCGRPTLYGNPFVVGVDGPRGTCCVKFDKWLDTGENFGCLQATEFKRQWILSHISELKGLDLECWCWPDRCHCETLAIRANK